MNFFASLSVQEEGPADLRQLSLSYIAKRTVGSIRLEEGFGG